MTLPPGPRSPAFVQGMQYLVRPLPWLEELHARYGPRCTVRMTGLGTFVLLADPDDCKAVFTAPDDVLLGGAANDILAPLVGQRSILLLDGREHLRQRRLMLPPFHGERMAAYREVVAKATEARIAGWREGDVVRLHEHFRAITLEVISRAVFGMPPGRLTDVLARALDVSDGAVGSMVTRLGGSQTPFARAVREADALIAAEIAERRRDPELEARDDVFSMLMLARDEEGRPLSDAELRDELVTLLAAGHETTATALAWTWERLLRNPSSLERLDEDEWVGAVVREALRVRTVLPFTTRVVASSFSLDDRTPVPAGTFVCPWIHVVNHDAAAYPEPGAFRPERFLGDRPATYGWLPFGGGGRRCLGASFALMEMETVVATMASRLRLEPVDPADEAPRRRGIALTPAKGAQARVLALL
jgi:cytochrome P450